MVSGEMGNSHLEQGLIYAYKRNVRLPTEQLEQSDEEDGDEEEILITRPCSVQKPATKFDPKGKEHCKISRGNKKDQGTLVSEVPKIKANFYLLPHCCEKKKSKGVLRASFHT